MHCKNCDQNFVGEFCNHCGQNARVQRVDSNYILGQISSSLLQIDRGFLFTMKEMFIRPGHSIREYLAGKRVQHFKPVTYLLLISAIYVAVTFFIDQKIYLSSFIYGINEGLNEGSSELPNWAKGLSWLAGNYAYTTLLLLPFFRSQHFYLSKNMVTTTSNI